MDLKEKIVSQIKKIYDPEIPVNIYELGLIYDISVNDKKEVHIKIHQSIPRMKIAVYEYPLTSQTSYHGSL